MNLKRIIIFLLLKAVFVLPLSAQFEFSRDTSILVNQEQGNPIAQPWAGGLNAIQYNRADLDGDGTEDLVLFDRTNYSLKTFLQTGNDLVYAPDYQDLFPQDLEGWMLMRDFNCDGKKDIFTHTSLGIRVFQNTGTGLIGFTLESNVLITERSTGTSNLAVNITDIPAIEDIDGDGDLDILTFDPQIGGNVEYHQNLSIENSGNCNELTFQETTPRFGDFEECFCSDFAFGDERCDDDGGRILHAGGKAILALDQDGDGVKDLVYGDESCNELMFLPNTGTAQDALIQSFDTLYPNANDPLRLFIFPAAYYEDGDGDGIRDLLVSPNVFNNVSLAIDFQNSNWFYRNTGTNQNPGFELVQQNFLQDQMIDLGERSAPASGDVTGDGLADLVVGYQTLVDGVAQGRLALFEGVLNGGEYELRLSNTDYLSFSTLNYFNIRPSLKDMNGDNAVDLIISFSDNPPIHNLALYLNESSPAEPLQIDLQNFQEASVSYTQFDTPDFFDFDEDGRVDLFLGRSNGGLDYYENSGVFSFTLIRNDILGTGGNPSRANLVSHISDLNLDGRADLVTLDNSGTLRVYPDFRTNDGSNSESGVIRNQLLDQLTNPRFASGYQLTSIQPLTSDPVRLVMGNISGGLELLQSETNGEPNPRDPIVLMAFPNPASGLMQISSNQTGELSLYSASGKLLRENDRIGFNEPLIFDMQTLTDGLYIFRIRVPDGRTKSVKIIVARGF